MQYALPRAIIQEELDFRELERQTDIWIYPLCNENSWTAYQAVVGINDQVFIFHVDRAVINKIERKPCLGVRPNGSLIY